MANHWWDWKLSRGDVNKCITKVKTCSWRFNFDCLKKDFHLCPISQLDTSRISRLLEHVSDDDDNEDPNFIRNKLNEYDDLNDADVDANNDVCVFPISSDRNADAAGEENIVIDVEDLLQLALDERKGKQEAKQVNETFAIESRFYRYCNAVI